jgi:uncharacterized protein
VTLINQARASILGDQIDLADSFLSRRVGLLNRKKLEHGAGLLLTGAFSIHTFGMNFPIDVVFIDRAGRVVGLSPDLQIGRMARNANAASVLELPAGTIAATGTELGDSITIEDRQRQVQMAPAYAGGNAC